MSDIEIFADLRPQFGAARDQGPRPTCLAFAASDAHAGIRSGWFPLSAEYAFHRAQARTGSSPDEGATLPSMLDGLREDGQPEETGWPYLAGTPTEIGSWKPPVDVGPLFRRSSGRGAGTFGHIAGEIEQGNPMMLLMTLSRSFYRPDPEGVVHPAAAEDPEPQRRHAVIAAGYGTARGHKALLVRNSWGPKWGIDGYAWITEAFLDPRIFATAKLTEDVGVSANPAAA